jgi:uncharacterized membrane protein YczE
LWSSMPRPTSAFGPPSPRQEPRCRRMAEALRNAGLVAALGAEDAGSVDPPAYRQEWSPGAGVRNGPAFAVYTRDLSDRVAELVAEDTYVVLLGGDCSILLEGPSRCARREGGHRGSDSKWPRPRSFYSRTTWRGGKPMFICGRFAKQGRVVIYRFLRMTVSCTVLGVGVALLLDAALGSDGYAALINGISLSFDMPFWAVNASVGLALVAMAWIRGIRPGLGTILQPLVVGATVSLAMPLLPTPIAYPLRRMELALAFPLLALGVAGYLASDLGAGPTEAAALAWNPPIPFMWSYTIVQIGGAVIGFALGAAVGPGSLVVVVLLGPTITWMQRVLFRADRAETGTRA